MYRTEVATDPYAIAAISSVLVALCGPLVLSPYKFAAFLTMITVNSVILCQYVSPAPRVTCPCAVGSKPHSPLAWHAAQA